jgi:uncharacterized protein
MVTVMEVDVARKRISLSMKGNAGAGQKAAGAVKTQGGPGRAPAAGGKGPGGGGSAGKGGGKKDEPLDAFQAKLQELKKKFKD